MAIVLFFSINLFAQTDREKGLAFYNDGDYKAAIESLEKSIAANENDGIALRFLGMAYARTNNKKQANVIFKKALKFPDQDLNKEFEKPMEIITKSTARYTEQGRKNGTSGKVVLFVEFGKDGQIGNIFPYKKLPDGLTENAILATREITFNPAVKDGKPVTVIKFIEHSFTIY